MVNRASKSAIFVGHFKDYRPVKKKRKKSEAAKKKASELKKKAWANTDYILRSKRYENNLREINEGKNKPKKNKVLKLPIKPTTAEGVAVLQEFFKTGNKKERKPIDKIKPEEVELLNRDVKVVPPPVELESNDKLKAEKKIATAAKKQAKKEKLEKIPLELKFQYKRIEKTFDFKIYRNTGLIFHNKFEHQTLSKDQLQLIADKFEEALLESNKEFKKVNFKELFSTLIK